MLALEEFANFVNLNMANLVATYTRLLAEKEEGYETFQADSVTTSARRLLEAITEACQSGTSDPLCRLFDGRTSDPLRWTDKNNIAPPQSLLEVECLGQTLTPVVTNLEASKFLWQILSEVRAMVFQAVADMPSSTPTLSQNDEQKEQPPLHDAERKQLEEQLRKLSRAVEQSANTIVITDTRGVIEYVNPKFTETTGYTPEEAIGQHTRILKSGETSAREYKRLWKTLAAGGEWRGEFHNKKKNGELYWESASISPIRNEGGVVTHFLAVKEDITARKEAEKALKESEERTRLILDTAFDAVITIDAEGVITGWNVQAETIFGWSHQEAVGRSLHDTIIPAQYRKAHWRGLKRFLATGERRVLNRRIEITALHQDGHEFPVELAISSVWLTEIVTFTAFVQDITERKQAEEELAIYRDHLEELVEERTVELEKEVTERTQAEELLRESEEKYRTILENIEDGYYETDLAGNMIFFNDALCKIIGYPADELMGMNNRQYTDKENARKLYQAFNRIYRTGEPAKGIVWEVIRKDGSKAYIETSATLIKDAAGQPVGYRGIARDITERRQAEAEREQLLAETERRARELAVIQKITAAINAGDRVLESLPAVVEHLRDLVPVDVLTLVAYTPGESECRLFVLGAEMEASYFAQPGVRPPLEGTGPGWVITHNDVWLDEDFREAKPFMEDEQLAAEGLAARLLLPLRLGGQVIGTLNLASAQPGAFNETHLPPLWQVAGQMATALERGRLFEQLQRRARREQTIREITEKMRAATSLEGLVKTTAEELGQRLSAGHAVLELGIEAGSPAGGVTNHRPGDGQVEQSIEQTWQKAEIAARAGQYHYARPDAPVLDEATLTRAKQQALTQKQPAIVTINGDNSDPKPGSEIENPKSSAKPPRGKIRTPQSIVAPITFHDETIGTLQLHPAGNDQTWTKDDLALIEAVINQLAQRAENLRLFEETRERASLERATREITDKLRAEPNLDGLLETAARELGQRLGVRHTVLELGIKTGQEGDGLNDQNNARAEVG